MSIKVNERGRGKFKPAPDYNPEQVKEVLLERIKDEKTKQISDNDSPSYWDIDYDHGKMNTISLFSGAGGLDLGMELAGISAALGEDKAKEAFESKEAFKKHKQSSVFKTIYSNDIFKEALETYKRNQGNGVYFHKQDIRKIRDFPSANIVLGGFPCPGFSEAGPRLVDDERNFLYLHFIRCLMQVQPEIFVGENVKGMMNLGKGEVFKQIVEDFAAAGYTLYTQLVNSRDYGVPQIRERVILVGVRNDLDFEYNFPEPTHGKNPKQKPFVTLRDAIGDLEKNPGIYYKGSYSTIFMSRNRKKGWDEQSFTIQASGRQAPIHPSGQPMEKLGPNEWIFKDGEDNNRRLSIKEIKRIQTFPDWYDFSLENTLTPENIKNSQVDKAYKQIGNAVPVLLAKNILQPIADWAVNHVKEKKNQQSQLRLFT